MFELKGIYTPIATPFKGTEIDWEALEKNLQFWCGSRLEGIVVMGSNGESVALTWDEKVAMTKFCCEKAKGKKKIIIGTGGNSINETMALNDLAYECGADAVLIITPFYYKGAMKDAVLENYFTKVADTSKLPVVLYNMPANTGVNLSADVMIRLSKHPNIVGVKDTSGNITQIAQTINGCDPSFSVFAGNWAFLLPTLLLGGKGGTLALGNVAPNECVELLDLVEAGKLEEARKHAARLFPVNAAVTAKYGIGGLKAAMELRGLCGGEPRLPLRRPNEEGLEDIRNILKTAGLI